MKFTMWSSVAPLDINSPAPSARSKHSATLVGEHVYLLGGRNGNLPMKDLWRYNLATGKWKELRPSGDKLPLLQEHSAVAYQECIYVFGGEVGFSAGTETPLWCYNIKTNSWKKIRSKKGVTTPKGRRGHTALIYRGTMLIYGGYQDLRGSCGDLWAYHFETESWHLLSSSAGKPSDLYPASRHKHSAIIHDDAMWIFGGMTDLQERGDLWKWDIVSKNWTNIKTKLNPGLLHSHGACKLPSSMVIFGGERNGQPTNELWKFHFVMESWEKIVISGTKPQPRSESVVFVVSELLLKANSSNTLESKSARIRSQTCISADRNGRHSSYFPNNRVAPCEKTYVFKPTQSNYTDGSDVISPENKSTRSFLQEISKLSQMNISKLNNRCTYTVLTGCVTDSTESLLRQQTGLTESENEASTPVKGSLVKSKSAYVIKKKYQLEESMKDNLINKKRVEFDPSSQKLSRDPISVPNFAALNTQTSELTPIEVAKLVNLDTDNETDVPNTMNDEDILQVEPGDSNNLEVFGTVKREESYSSHLGYADNPLYQHMINLSSSKAHNCMTFVEHNNECISSTSDYASIETMNRLSSASNYSVKTNNLQEENQKNQEKGPFGFCNPNYFGPEIRNILDGNVKTNLEDNTKLHNSEEELLELQELNGIITKDTKVYFKNSARNRPPNFFALDNNSKRPNQSKNRALSAGRVEKHNVERNFDKVVDSFIPLYIYVMGGKERGQVTVFQRPISIWKLQLF